MRQFTNLTLALFAIFLTSCSNDTFQEETINNSSTDNGIKVEVPCEFNLDSYSSGDEIIINCDYDLNGQTITLPENVILKYDGGILTNGTIILDGGNIDGELLNIGLEIEGSTRLTSTDFIFEKEKWNITEGDVSTSVALTNRININKAISQVKSFRGYTFEVNDLDAYFDVQAGYGGSKIENWRRSIQIPSNFHFKMNENTHIRVQPNDKRDYALLCTWETTNTKISGGHLWGDRYTHDYDGGDTGPQDLGYGVYFIGSVASMIDGTSSNEFTGDGLVVSSPKIRNDDGSPKAGTQYSADITIKNCEFDSNRRNGLSLTDVIGAVLDNNSYTNSGDGGAYSPSAEGYSWKGVLPKHGIDLEAINPVENGVMRITEIVKDVQISNSTFNSNHAGDIDFFKASEVDVFGNTFGAGCGNIGSFNVKIHHNTFIADNPDRPRGINIKPLIREDGSHFVKNWEVYNNTISGYKNGISIGGQGHTIYNNTVTDFDNGIFFLEGLDNEINNNILVSERANSRGFYNYPGGVSLENTHVNGGSVDVTSFPFLAKKINENGDGVSGDTGLTFDGVDFVSSSNYNVDIRNSGHITIRNSSTSGDITHSDSVNITLENNN